MATLRQAISTLPLLMKFGLGVASLGAVIDVTYHVASDSPGIGHGPVAFAGHLVTLAGMVITLIGLFGVALRRRPVEVRPTTKGEVR